jgi:hypothetical protein
MYLFSILSRWGGKSLISHFAENDVEWLHLKSMVDAGASGSATIRYLTCKTRRVVVKPAANVGFRDGSCCEFSR